MRLRRRLLEWHQAIGFATLAALALADVIGTLNFYDKYAVGGSDNGSFSTWHEGLGIGTTASFAVTGILALAAPNPYPKPRNDPEAAASALAVVDVVAAVLAPYRLGATELIHAIRAFRAALHGFVTLEQAHGFGPPRKIDDSYGRLVELFIAGLATMGRSR